MNKYTIKFWLREYEKGYGFKSHFTELDVIYSNLVEVVGAIKAIFDIYTSTMVKEVAVCKNDIPFKIYARGDFNEKK